MSGHYQLAIWINLFLPEWFLSPNKEERANVVEHGNSAHIPGMSSRLSSYLTIMLAEWFLVFLIWLRIRRRGLTVASLVSGRWETPRSFFKDLGLGVGFVVASIALEQALALLLHASPDSGLERTMPTTVLELAVYLILAVTGGFCEELIFRGYLMRKFSACKGHLEVMPRNRANRL